MENSQFLLINLKKTIIKLDLHHRKPERAAVKKHIQCNYWRQNDPRKMSSSRAHAAKLLSRYSTPKLAGKMTLFASWKMNGSLTCIVHTFPATFNFYKMPKKERIPTPFKIKTRNLYFITSSYALAMTMISKEFPKFHF